MSDERQAYVTPIESLLRRVEETAWASVTEESGWTYSTNIGHLTHWAADEIERLRAQLAEAQAERKRQSDADAEVSGVAP